MDEQVVIEAPSDGGASGYELTVSQGRALANGVIQAYALACDKREPNTRDDLSIRWFVAVVGDHIRVSVELLEPTDVYWLEDAEAVGLAMALLLACDSAERLGGVGLDDDAASLIEETLRLAGPSVSRLRNLAREDEGDDTSVGDDDDR